MTEVLRKQLLNAPIIGERISDVSERWSTVTLDQVLDQMPNPETVEAMNGRRVKAVMIEPSGKEVDESETLVSFASFAQRYTPAHYIGASIVRDVVAPSSRLIMFQNNSRSNDVHEVDKDLELGIRERSDSFS